MSEKSLKNSDSYQSLMSCNHENICSAPHHGLTVIAEQSLKSNNSIKIWCTVTSKQYVLYNLIVYLSIKFQPHLMKTVGSGRSDQN